MPITIGSNIAALQAQRRLNEGSETLSRVYERLSSGQRINRASDDAAGLAIASSLGADARVFTQAIRNVQDGLSATTIAESALHSLLDITQRQSELAEQAANGTYSGPQRQALNSESSALTSEFNRIVATTQFNGLSLLGGVNQQLSIQVGRGVNEILTLNLPSITVAHLVGDGTFSAGVSYATSGTNPTQLLTADFNADGYLDYSTMDAIGTNIISVFINNGNGTFKAATSLATIGNPREFLSRDYNGDGILDIAVVSSGPNPSAIGVLIGNGNGTFKGITAYNTSADSSFNIDSADFNGDGRPDLVATDLETETVSVLLNNGNGTFMPAASYGTGLTPGDVITVDVDSDGYTDIVVNSQNSRAFSVYINNGNGTFKAPGSYSEGTLDPRDFTFVDLDGNGALDMLINNSVGNTISVALNNGNGTFKSVQMYTTGTSPLSYTTQDLNGDGRLDIVTADSSGGTVSVLLNNGNGSFKATVSYTAPSAHGITSFDTNGDGFSDLVTLDTSAGSARVLLNNGNGTFLASKSFGTAATPTTLAAGDLNGDGVNDLVIGNYSTNTSTVLLANTRLGGSVGAIPLDLTSQTSAKAALDTLDATRANLVQALSGIGAFQSRLAVTANLLAVRRENYLSAQARISDADIAAESALLVRTQILQQAASAVLAQANQQPALALQLLRG